MSASAKATQHARTHTGENDSPAIEALTVLAERLVVEVVLDLFSKKYALRVPPSAA